MTRFATIAAAVLAAICLMQALLMFQQGKSISQLEQQVAESEANLEQNRSSLEAKTETVSQLEGKLTELAAALTDSTAQVNHLSERVQKFEAEARAQADAAAEEQKREEKFAAMMAEVPAPTITRGKDSAGRETRTYVFPKLIGIRDQVLATDAEFSDIYGRRLVFKTADGSPLAFDMQELHPGVLGHLNIDPSAARKEQQAIEDQKRESREDARKRMLARQEAERQAAVRRAQAAETLRAQQTEAQLELRRLETERLKAEAAMREADAALEQARTMQQDSMGVVGALLRARAGSSSN